MKLEGSSNPTPALHTLRLADLPLRMVAFYTDPYFDWAESPHSCWEVHALKGASVQHWLLRNEVDRVGSRHAETVLEVRIDWDTQSINQLNYKEVTTLSYNVEVKIEYGDILDSTESVMLLRRVLDKVRDVVKWLESDPEDARGIPMSQRMLTVLQKHYADEDARLAECAQKRAYDTPFTKAQAKAVLNELKDEAKIRNTKMRVKFAGRAGTLEEGGDFAVFATPESFLNSKNEYDWRVKLRYDHRYGRPVAEKVVLSKLQEYASYPKTKELWEENDHFYIQPS